MKVQRQGSEFGESCPTRFEVKVGVHQGSVLSPLLFDIVVDMTMESVRNCLISEMLYVDDLVLTSEIMEGLREKFWK